MVQQVIKLFTIVKPLIGLQYTLVLRRLASFEIIGYLDMQFKSYPTTNTFLSTIFIDKPISTCPLTAAKCNGVRPLLSEVLGLAP